MTKFIPILPLSNVVYPGQKLNLHIFEPRYKQLIQECMTENKTFGIPSSFKGALNECGTEMRLLEVSKTYANGEMDIKTEGVMVFKLIEMIREIPNKLYSAAIVL
jgi:Lon protease-like protein